MGPNLIFDKSFLECLNIDESVWLDTFFSTNITPLFYIEVLADLEKKDNKERLPEMVVSNLAEKTPDIHTVANVTHHSMIHSELTGIQKVDLRLGRPVVGGGRDTFIDGKKGAVFEQSPEEKMLTRWQSGKFTDEDRHQAQAWRKALTLISPVDQALKFVGWFGARKPVNLEEVRDYADSFIDGDNRLSALSYGLSLFKVDSNISTNVLQRWDQANRPTLKEFAPYFRHTYRVELFFYLARAANLISNRISNKVDIEYLYYLPFCMAFVSNDKLHRKTVPLFLESHQSFVWGEDLKRDLKKLDRHYDSLPDDEKAKGISTFASYPPTDSSFLVTQLWDKHMNPSWRTNKNSKIVRDPDKDQELISDLNRLANAPEVRNINSEQTTQEPDYMVTKRYVHKKKGKWNRFPPEVDKL